ncbi:MAG: YHYH protein [Caldilineaceae bacterium]
MSKVQTIIVAISIALICFILGVAAALAQDSIVLPLVRTGGGISQPAEQPTSTPTSPAQPAPTAAPTTQPTGDACPDETFIDVQPHPANSAYPDPELNVTCSASEMVVQTNNIPNFEFVQITPNGLAAQNYTFRLPLNPTVADSTTDVPLVGGSAVSVNGLIIFGPTEAPRDGSQDPYLDGILDYCNGHTAQRGDYHFHARPDCIFEGLSQPTVQNVGRVVAYAFDGFPILAPYVCEDDACSRIKELQSSWVDANPNLSNAWERHEYVPGAGDLDECNGMYLADGSYAYFATDTFPYMVLSRCGGGEQCDWGGRRGKQCWLTATNAWVFEYDWGNCQRLCGRREPWSATPDGCAPRLAQIDRHGMHRRHGVNAEH